jgi:delta8-fatty-acid desaturase
MHFLRVEVERRILEGETLIVYRGKLLRISQSWLSRHPGGSLSLLHFVGRDASDEIEAYHSEKALQLLRKFIIGTVELDENGFWVPFLPPVMSGWVRQDGKWLNEAAPIHISDAIPSEVFLVEKTDYAPSSSGPTSDTLSTSKSTLSLQTQARYSAAYRALHQRIIDQGLYQTPYVSGYGFEALTFLLLGGASGYSYHSGWTNLSAFFLGLLWHQLVFTCHDLGHMGVTHDWATDRLVSIFLADFIGGLSIGWWVEV